MLQIGRTDIAALAPRSRDKLIQSAYAEAIRNLGSEDPELKKRGEIGLEKLNLVFQARDPKVQSVLATLLFTLPHTPEYVSQFDALSRLRAEDKATAPALAYLLNISLVAESCRGHILAALSVMGRDVQVAFPELIKFGRGTYSGKLAVMRIIAKVESSITDPGPTTSALIDEMRNEHLSAEFRLSSALLVAAHRSGTIASQAVDAVAEILPKLETRMDEAVQCLYSFAVKIASDSALQRAYNHAVVTDLLNVSEEDQETGQAPSIRPQKRAILLRNALFYCLDNPTLSIRRTAAEALIRLDELDDRITEAMKPFP